MLRLQAQELERYHTEKKDHELQEMEIRRLTFDARLREYDEKFAREIDEMPDDDWDEYGDDFEKPVDPSPSKNPSSIPLEVCFLRKLSIQGPFFPCCKSIKARGSTHLILVIYIINPASLSESILFRHLSKLNYKLLNGRKLSKNKI